MLITLYKGFELVMSSIPERCRNCFGFLTQKRHRNEEGVDWTSNHAKLQDTCREVIQYWHLFCFNWPC